MSAERAAFHVARAYMLADALMDLAALETLLPGRKAVTLVTSLRVLKDELGLAKAVLSPRREPFHMR